MVRTKPASTSTPKKPDNSLNGTYWVTVLPGHKIHAAGSRFLVIAEPHENWLLCWKDGVKLVNSGTYLHESQVKRERKEVQPEN